MPASHQFFTGRMPFVPPKQQRQSTEGKQWLLSIKNLLSHFTSQQWGYAQFEAQFMICSILKFPKVGYVH